MTYELYINDVLCDLTQDETLTLVYQSPIFSELDIIQSNRSYNISLPMTENNMRAIEHSQRTDVDSDVPYKRLPARLYQDGVALFDNGVAVITSIADTIDVTLTWGSVDNFQTLFDADMSDLADTLYDMELGNIAWNENIQRVTPPNHRDLGYFYVDFGMGVRSYPECLHPCIGLDRVIEAIERYNGIKIADKARLYGHGDYPDLVPLVSENCDEKSNEAEAAIIQPGLDITGYSRFYHFNFYTVALKQDPRGILNGYEDISKKAWFDVSSNDKAGVKINAPIGDYFIVEMGQYLSPSAPDKISIKILCTPVGSVYYGLEEVFSVDSYMKVGNSYYFHPINESLDVSKYKRLVISIYPPEGYYTHFVAADIRLNISVSVFLDWSDLVYPTLFPVAPNLPDMSQGDFISALLAREGLFAYADLEEPDTIRLMSADDIVAKLNKSDFVDWSGKVILNDSRRVDMPNGSEFEIEDYAQKNTLDYDNDDDVKAKTEGVITIENEKLERENEAVSLPFSASDNTSENGIECAIIRMFSTSESSDRIDYTEPSPRILTQNEYKPETGGQTGEYVGIFTREQYFGGEQGIVATKYKTLQDILRRFRMITVNARLSPVDLRQLDYTRPVYISQFGSMFAIYSIETGENISECKLIQLKMDSVLPVTYFLTLNGEEQDYTLSDISADGLSVRVDFDTNGTLVAEYDDEQGMISGGFINADEKYIWLLVDTNITNSERTATVKLKISEDASVVRNIVLSQQAAQPSSKTITGRVTSQSGRALSLATVKVGDLGTGTTTSTGRFSINISEIPGQAVEITVSRNGYFTKTFSTIIDSSTIQDIGTIQLESTVITIKNVKLYCPDFSGTTKNVTFSIKDTAYSATMSLSFDSTGNVSVNQNTLARNLGITSMKDYVGSILKAEAAGNYTGTAEIYDGDFGIIMQSISPVSNVPADPGEEETPEEPTETPEINE